MGRTGGTPAQRVVYKRSESDVPLQFVFFLCLFLLVYVYALYPVVVFALASMVRARRDFRHKRTGAERLAGFDEKQALPSVSVVISVYNEERVIEERIKNCLSVDYPRDKMEIIIASDGSTDRTNDIVKAYSEAGVRLLAFDKRHGKSFALNRAIPQANGEILLLTDSNTMYEKDAVLKLVRHFRDPNVGGVCGELRVKPFDNATVEESIYWKFENFLKSMESPLNMTLGANGGVYAIRKDAFRPIPDGTIIDDFIIFLNVRKSRYRTVFDPEAVAFERSAPSLKDEYWRKVRIGAGDFQAIRLAGSFLNPKSGAVSFSFWSHKVLRWLVPFFLIGFLVCNIALVRENTFFMICVILQLLFYALFVVGVFYRNPVYFKVPYYFVSMNMALLHGFIRYVFGRQKGTWERTER